MFTASFAVRLSTAGQCFPKRELTEVVACGQRRWFASETIFKAALVSGSQRRQLTERHDFLNVGAACFSTCVGGASSGSGVRRRRHRNHGEDLGAFKGSVLAMQGEWGDDLGHDIKISGSQATFGDESGVWRFESKDGSLQLRGAQLTGTTKAPVWTFPDGVERKWARIDPEGIGDKQWAAAFIDYKEGRLHLRREMKAAFDAQDLTLAMGLKAAWIKGNTESVPSPSSVTVPPNLLEGCFLIPGSCFRHKRFGYRAAILACEPWCIAPARWRATMGVPQLPRGEAQPFYHCLVDERDRPGGHITFVSEENMEFSEIAFPIEGPLTNFLLVRCDVLGCYFPSLMLETVLEKQRRPGGLGL